jgi:hypothetical protein
MHLGVYNARGIHACRTVPEMKHTDGMTEKDDFHTVRLFCLTSCVQRIHDQGVRLPTRSQTMVSKK